MVAAKAAKPLGTLALVALIFFDVAGTPAGCENAVVAAGALPSLIGFLVMPFVWSIPEAMFTAELASMFPEDAGFVQWVAAAFGEQAGFVEGGISWVATVTDGAIYPVMICNYLATSLPTLEHDQVARKLTMAAVVFGLSLFNYFGLKFVGWGALLLVVLCLLPFLAFCFVGVGHVNTSRWTESKNTEDIDWGLFFNTLFWNLNYFDSVATLAGEVDKPAKTFPRALLMGVVLVMTMYLLPLSVAIGVSNGTSEWTDSEYGNLGKQIGGGWLQSWLVGAVVLGCVGMYEADLSCGSYQLLGMAERGMLPKIFAVRSRFGTPTLGLVLATGVAWVCIFLSLDQLVELLNVMYLWAAVLEIAAFLRLRWAHPDLPRPFQIPLSNVAVTAMLTPTLFFIGVVAYFSSWQAHLTAVICCAMSCCGAVGMARLRRRRPRLFLRGRFPATTGPGTDALEPFDDDDDDGNIADTIQLLPTAPGSQSARSGSPCSRSPLALQLVGDQDSD